MSLRKIIKRLRPTPKTLSQDDEPPLSLEPIDESNNLSSSQNDLSHQSEAHSPNSERFARSERQSPAPSMQSKSSTGVRTKKKKQPTPRRGKRDQANESIDSETTSQIEDSNFYESILYNRSSVQQLATRWIADYKADKDRALLSLNQFFLNSCACKGEITPEMQGAEDSVIIREMINELDPENGEYPLITPGQKWQKFRASFSKFIRQIVVQSKNSIIYDQILLTKISNFLVALSDSQVRAFRHTATLAAMKLTTALVEVASEVSKNLKITTRQIEAETKKTGGRQGERLEALTAKFEELEENFTDLKEKLNALFASVFVFRYIDVFADIRVICMIEVGNWMVIFPELFLNDRYIKYVGWNLYDKSGEVRFNCIQSLLPLYDSDRFKPKLEGFTSKFKDRIVAMVLDKDSEVAVEAVKLVTQILKYYREFLTDADCEHVYELVYSSDRRVAQATGLFLKERLFTPDEESVGVFRSARGKQRLPNTPLIRDLVLFFIESELHEHGAYLVDALIDSNPMIKDWECMIDLLLEDPGSQEEPLNDQAESCLVDIMVCSVKQAATGEGPVGRTPAKKPHTKTELNQIAEDKKKLTESFIPTLPHLLEKYQADPEKLCNLLIIPQYFDLSIYTNLRQEQNLDLLLRKINEIVATVQHVDSLETAAKTLEFLCAEDSPIFAQTNVSRSLLIDSIVDRYKQAIVNYRNEIANSDLPDEDELFNVVQSLKKLSILYCSHDINSWNIQDSLFRDIEEAKNSAESFSNDAIVYCIIACRFSLLWGQNRLIHPVDDQNTEFTGEARQLKQRLDYFMESMMYFVDSGRPNVSASPEVREEAYTTICDLLVVFSNQLRQNVHAWVHLLVYEVDNHMQAILNRYVQERVFTEVGEVAECDEQKKIEELHKRRNLLAGYCKLIAFNIMPTKYAADIFKHYVKFYNDYGDIISTTIGKARSLNKVNCALTMLHSLITLWHEAEKEQMEMKWDDRRPIKDLARRFALHFGLQAALNRHAITALHRTGINFATAPDRSATNSFDPPPNLGFLEVLEEFTKKLLKQDKRPVLDYLNSKVQGIIPSNPSKEWKPLIYYRNSLSSSGTGQATAASRKDNAENEAGNNEENAANDESAKNAKGKKKKTRVTRKNPLPVTKVTIPRDTKTPSLQGTNVTLTPDSPGPVIDDSSQFITEEDIECDEEDDVESLVLGKRPKNHHQDHKNQLPVRYPTATELFADEELMDLGSE